MRSFSPSFSPPSRPRAPSVAAIALAFVRSSALIPENGGDGVALLHLVDALAGRVAAGDLLLGLRQQRDVFRHDAGLEAGIGVLLRRTFGGIGQLDVGLRGAAGRIRSRIGERRIAHAGAVAAPVRGVPHPHQHFVERDDGGDFRLRQHRAEILGDEGNLGIGFGGVRLGVGIVGGGRRGRAHVGQHALRIEWRDLRGQVARSHRQVAGDAHERTHPHHVTVADAGHGRDAHDIARGGRLARRRQAVALVQADGAIIGAECAAQRAFDALRHPGKGHFAVERRKNGAADEGRAAQAGQDGAAEPLYGHAAAVDHRGFRAVDRKRGLVAEIDHADLASIAASA